MKRVLALLLLYFGSYEVYCQTETIIRNKLDSIMNRVESEKDPNTRIGMLLSIFSIPVEEYPNLVLYCHERTYEISKKTKSKADEAFAWSLAGHGYRLTGDYIKGLEFHNKAVAMAEEAGDPVVLGFSRTVLAHLYKDREEYRKALNLYLAANRIEPKGKSEDIIIYWSGLNLSKVYLDINQIDSSLYYGTRDEIPINRAAAYSKLGKVAEAETLFNECVDYYKKRIAKRGLSYVYLEMAKHFERYQQIDSATYYARQSITCLENSEYQYLAMKPAKLLSNIYLEINADSSLKYLKIYSAANDSLYSTRANHQVQMMTMEEEMRQRNMENEKAEYQNRIKLIVMGAALLVFLLIVLILYNNNKQKQKTNKLLESTLSNLKSTQAQLIQAEKMASLGDLTAGIAHEIQNPLNFINNFSELNCELINELKEEIAKGNLSEIDELASNLSENEPKITHHGKRADAIVKGMLAHSRSHSGENTPTDINALCDEYLRLSYQGFRSKNNEFNAEINTNFDPSLPKIPVIAQDIGRVLLNILNNAFYAVLSAPFPLINVSTKNTGDKIQISISDNGSGIPDHIKDKIFQPFFTTKPTGQGTGLGLSLSYDIVKAHGGEIKVICDQPKGTVFIIELPKN